VAVLVCVTLSLGSGAFWIFYAYVGYTQATIGSHADWLTAGATVVLVILTTVLAGVGVWQIWAVKYNQQTWTSLQACDRYDLEPPIVEARDNLRSAAQDVEESGSAIFSKCQERKIAQSARRLLNFFDAIAIGIKQKLYRDGLVKEHLQDVIRFALNDMVICKAKVAAVGNDLDEIREHYATLIKMLERWKVDTEAVRSRPAS